MLDASPNQVVPSTPKLRFHHSTPLSVQISRFYATSPADLNTDGYNTPIIHNGDIILNQRDSPVTQREGPIRAFSLRETPIRVFSRRETTIRALTQPRMSLAACTPKQLTQETAAWPPQHSKLDSSQSSVSHYQEVPCTPAGSDSCNKVRRTKLKTKSKDHSCTSVVISKKPYFTLDDADIFSEDEDAVNKSIPAPEANESEIFE